MLAYFNYFKYVLRHKWFVFIECCKMGIVWRGIIHDWSKFLPSEFFPYAEHFYGKNSHHRNDSHAPTGNTEDIAFDFAWLLHLKRNRHHWQWWILREDKGRMKVLEMLIKYVEEMYCDWKGAGKAQGHGDDVISWYYKNRTKMILYENTRIVIERLLDNEIYDIEFLKKEIFLATRIPKGYLSNGEK